MERLQILESDLSLPYALTVYSWMCLLTLSKISFLEDLEDWYLSPIIAVNIQGQL